MIVVAFVVVTVIMIFVIPAFKQVFLPPLVRTCPRPVRHLDERFFVTYWWLIFGVIGGGFYFFNAGLEARGRCRCSWTVCC